MPAASKNHPNGWLWDQDLYAVLIQTSSKVIYAKDPINGINMEIGANTFFDIAYNRFFRKTNGYTLIELMIALVLSTAFILAVFTFSSMSIRSYRNQEQIADAQQSVRAAMDLMVRDIRMAGYDPMALSHGPSEGIGIIVATENMLQFSADLNGNRADDNGLENMTYFFEPYSNRLRQKEGGASYAQTFIDHVSALRFEYLDAGGGPAEEKSDIATVVVTLTVGDKNQKGVLVIRTLSTRVNCRNLRM